MKKRYEAIIFDLDGTISDTEQLWRRVTNDFLSKRGIVIPLEQSEELHKQLHGSSLITAARLLKALFGIADELHDIMKEKKNRVLEIYHEEVRFIDGFVNFHLQTVQRGLKSGIATNADDHTLAAIKQTLKLEQFFGEHIYNISHVNNVPKPDPALYEHAATRLGASPLNCIAVEDSAPGIEAAKRAGMFCIGINTSKKPEYTQKADLIVDHYDHIQLVKILEGL